MRSRPEGAPRFLLAVLAVAAALRLAVAQEAASGPQAMQSAGPSESQIAAALDKARADPNLATQGTMRTLKWVDSGDADEPSRPRDSGWIRWMRGLFGWIGESARVLLWVAIAVLASALVIYIVRLVRERGLPEADGRFVAPSHVRDLDIRPESLPPDVGAAARALWERGEHRAALALLYRGLLSRLANVYGVPIRASSTEGDCLALATRHVSEERSCYAAQLVRVWQRAVYGAKAAETATVWALCDGFAVLDAVPEAAAMQGAVAAGQRA